MSNPPAGWYPDPTGQPNIIRFWNGEKWTNQTEHEDTHRDPAPDDSPQPPSTPEPTQVRPAPEPTQPAPAAPRQEPVAPTPETFAPGQEPVAPRQETVAPRQEPVAAQPETVAPRQETSAPRQEPVVSRQQSAGPGLRSVQGPRTGTPVSQPEAQSEQADGGGWWQPAPTPQLRNAAPTGQSDGPHLRAVTPEESAQEQGPTPAERARATWGAPEIAPAPPEHWTQREVTDEQELVAAPEVQPEEPAGNWTLKLAPEPADEPTVIAPIQPAAEADAGADSREGWSDVSWTAQPRFAPTPKEDVQAANADVQAADTGEDEVPAADAAAGEAAAADVAAADGAAADVRSPELQNAELDADAAQTAAQLQPDWGDQSDSQQYQQDQASDQPSWGVEAQDEDDLQTPEQTTAAPLWSMPQPDDATQEQPVWNATQPPDQVQLWADQPQSPDPQNPYGPNQNWGTPQPAQPEQTWGTPQSGQPEQTWGAAQSGQPEQSWGAAQGGQQEQGQGWGAGQAEQGQAWGAQQGAAGTDSHAQAGDNGWGVDDQHGVEDSGPWGQQATAQTQNGQHTGDEPWGGQSWPVQQSADQQTDNGWGESQQTDNGWGESQQSDNGWGESQQTASPSWGATQQNGTQSWTDGQQNGQQNGQQGDGGSWAGDQQQGSGQSWGAGQQTAPEQWAPQQNAGQQNGVRQGGVQQGAGGPQGLQQGGAGGGQQAWGEQQGPRAWGEDGNESWGGQTDLSTGVGKREKGQKKSKSPGGGGGGFGAKLPLIVGGGIALVLLIVAAVFLITRPGDDKKADPNPTGATQPTGSPTGQSSAKPGQSKNPKLHEGSGRISSDAISFPRRNPPWSDRKRLVQQLLNSSGQHIVLQEKVNGGDDWSADIFVGGLGTGSGFNGDPKATAANLSVQLRTGMYGSIPVTYRTIANGAVKRTDKSGWFFQQSVTAKSAAVTDRVLTLTVAVFDLGDGTAVAYISGIPNNRPDLKAAEIQAYKGINVG